MGDKNEVCDYFQVALEGHQAETTIIQLVRLVFTMDLPGPTARKFEDIGACWFVGWMTAGVARAIRVIIPLKLTYRK